MKLSEVQSLTANYSKSDVDELVAVMQSTLLTSGHAARLRWEGVKHEDATEWLTGTTTKAFEGEFKLKRISSMTEDDELPKVGCAEHLVIRDLDVDSHEANGSASSQGLIVAHADYRFNPGFDDDTSKSSTGDANSHNTDATLPPGLNQELHSMINQDVIGAVSKLFSDLPAFELVGISTLMPSYVRKGIAKRLVEWIFPYAEHFNLPVILIASPLGLPLYRKCGFQEYREHDVAIDLSRWGVEHTHRHVVMVRWPSDVSTLSNAWKERKRSLGPATRPDEQ